MLRTEPKGREFIQKQFDYIIRPTPYSCKYSKDTPQPVSQGNYVADALGKISQVRTCANNDELGGWGPKSVSL